MTIAASVLHFSVTRPEAPAIVEGDNVISYGQLGALITRTASHLLSLGLKRGDRIGLCLRDTGDHLAVILAAAHLGVVATPLDWRARVPENARLVGTLGLARLVTEADLEASADCPIVALDGQWRKAVARAEIACPAAGEWADPFTISATSGTTGQPKFTVMTHAQYHFAVSGMAELMDLSGRNRYLCTMPLYYSGGRNSCIFHLLRGDCVVLYPHLFGPEEYAHLVQRYSITIGGLVPTAIRQLLLVVDDDPALVELSLLFSTGAPLHSEEKCLALTKLTPGFRERYGTAETLAVSMLRPENFADRAGSVGQPHSLIQASIADDDGQPVALGDPGRLRFRGPGVASPLPGPAEANFRDGWFYPGELARIDERGFIFLEGRVSDVIIRNGAKIHPAEVESVLLQHPGVIEAAVLARGRPDQDQTIVAFAVVREATTAGQLIAHCRTRLSPHKVPREFYFLSEFPRNTAGKTDKMALAGSLP